MAFADESISYPNTLYTSTWHGQVFSLELVAAPVNLAGDFDTNGVVDVVDIDLLAEAIRSEESDPEFDLDGSGMLGQEDFEFLIVNVISTWYGDANLDGEFNSSDLVTVFEAGKYEQDISTSWSEGDWNGDGRFGTDDLVTAFSDGGYEQGPRPALAAVPEPTGIGAMTMSLAVLAVSPTRRRGRRS